ncbi:hypothetical protein NQ318_011556 [Aromia moschata]|uniref:Mos1 transposase HTH domain-containing protein n=1 Tax=Aromia moschata TaxID=1265417 RepID=A0AAV8Z7N7_9CUCU|nr:hypothetical protein NQ318_011556 [Aromia moschata]
MGKTFTEAYAMLKEVTGMNVYPAHKFFEWFKRFKEGRETTEDDPHPGRPSTSKTDENIEKIDRRLSIRGLAEITGIDNGCCIRQILHESFNMSKVFSKMVPKLLTPEQKESIMNICAYILNNIDTDPWFMDHGPWMD